MTDVVEPRKVAVITGVSPSSLGLVIARGLAKGDHDVVIMDLPSSLVPSQRLAAEIQARFGVMAQAVPCDVTEEAQVAAAVDTACAASGRIDVLVSAAGRMLRKPVGETTRAEWQAILDVNLTGTWLMNRAVGKVMCSQESGRIINISSVYADRAGALPESAYYASKAGVSNLTRGLAGEFGPYGVTVNCIAPGVFYPTGMTADLADQPETFRLMRDRTMLGRLGDPERDIHGVVNFLASEEAAYVTGQTIYVDGGWSAW